MNRRDLLKGAAAVPVAAWAPLPAQNGHVHAYPGVTYVIPVSPPHATPPPYTYELIEAPSWMQVELDEKGIVRVYDQDGRPSDSYVDVEWVVPLQHE